jgi:hypothetical protein
MGYDHCPKLGAIQRLTEQLSAIASAPSRCDRPQLLVSLAVALMIGFLAMLPSELAQPVPALLFKLGECVFVNSNSCS